MPRQKQRRLTNVLLTLPKVPPELESELKRIEENARTLVRVSTTRATVAQTPKQVIWTLNKAKLYRYVPVVPPEQRHPVPLLLVFALMNKPYILDLRPGHSFIEYMLKVKGGHIGMMAGSGAQKYTWPQIKEWLDARSD